MLAKRIGNLATNLLVTGLILIVGIAFGREVISWWRSDSISRASSPMNAGVGDDIPFASAGRQLLEFGDFPFVLNRQEFVGTVTEVLDQLRGTCRATVDAAEPLVRELGPAEQRMLDATRRLVPVEERANVWSLYQIEAPLPMVVGLRRFGRQVATMDQRVVSWGLAIPDATPAGNRQAEWTLFTYSSDTTAATAFDRSIEFAPPGGRRTLSLRTDHGGTICGYAGFGRLESWTTFYDDLFAELPSTPGDRWQVDFGSSRRRFASAQKETIDVVIHHDGDNTLHSLVIASPNGREN